MKKRKSFNELVNESDLSELTKEFLKRSFEFNKQKKRRKILKITAILAVLICLVLAAIGYYLYSKGFRFWSDARPSPADVKKWTIDPPPQGFGETGPNGYRVWNADPEFEAAEFDTGVIKDSTLMVLQKDKDHTWNMKNLARGKEAIIIEPESAWGIQVYGWEINGAQEFAPDAGRISSRDGVLKIYTKMNKDGLYGNGTAIQGWTWDEPENTPWHSPFPLLTNGKNMVLSFKIKINKAETGGGKLDYDWQLLSVSTFLTSPEFKKPVVIDLAFYVNRNTMWSRESNENYHYQRLIVPARNKKDAFGKWKTYTIDYGWFVADALKRFNIEYAADTLQIESLEILSETMYGECEFEIDNLYLYYKPSPTSPPPPDGRGR